MGAEHSIAVLVEAIADRVVEKLRADGHGDFYTSKHLPPGCPSREAFNDRVRDIEGAYLDGKVWVCRVDAYEAHMRRGARPRPRPRKVERPAFDRVGALAQVSRTPKATAKGR